MRILVRPTQADAARLVAEMIGTQLRDAPHSVLGLATGRTMGRVYHELARLHAEAGLDFARCRSFNLDEYVGLGPDDPRSFRAFMRQHLVDAVNIAPGSVEVPRGDSADPALEAVRYEQRIAAAGGIDLQLLGIGENGHIGFNEPGTPFDAPTHVAVLTAETRRQNAAMFGGAVAVPQRAVTMGIGTILAARRIVLLATGAAKAAIVTRALAGPADLAIPGSALLLHRDCTVVLDETAAGTLRVDPAWLAQM